jgi:hypothetical protein
MNLLIYVCHKVLRFQRHIVYRCEQNLACSLHLSHVVFVTQVMSCELVF